MIIRAGIFACTFYVRKMDIFMHIFFEENMTGYKNLREKLEKLFQTAGVDDYADIDWIMCEILGKRRSELAFVREISAEDEAKIMEAAEKRMKYIPLGYIFGKTNFYGYDLMVNENVLIPRLDTEVLIETAIKEIKARENASVLDIGTGSGAIAIVLNKETGAKTTAVDVSEKALEVAKQNAISNNADVEFIHSNLFDNIGEIKVDFIISNPPYIESSVIAGLDKEVRDNEPILALDGGEDGLDFYRIIVKEAKNHLNPNGMLLFEIGYNQGEALKELMKDDFKNVRVIKDYGNNDRVVIGELL